jgi:diguanylate cyclase (GGDEF)-like protein
VVDIETHPPSRTGALVAHVYELIDRGPELDRNALMTMICDRALALAGANAAALWTIDPDGEMRPDQARGDRPSATGIAVERAFVDVVGKGEARIISSAEAPLIAASVEDCGKLERESSGAVCVALSRREELLGVLCLHRIGVGSFENWEAADAERFARFAALALHQLALRERAERDEVTGMPGRTLLLRSLNERLADGHVFALACIDFDGLKSVNETLGYEAGNELIRAVAAAIGDLLRPGELVGRLHGRGGDEFVCLLNEANQSALDSRCGVLEAALDRARVPPQLVSSYLGVSIGAALADRSISAGELFTRAESAMRRRKQERRLQQGRQPEPTPSA